MDNNLLGRFETWWEQHGQFCRAGGGDYEKTFAFRAWEAAEAGFEAIDNNEVFVLIVLSKDLECSHVLGVFDHVKLTDVELEQYFGKFTVASYKDVRDSGVEWIMKIDTESCGEYQLQLEHYRVNEI